MQGPAPKKGAGVLRTSHRFRTSLPAKQRDSASKVHLARRVPLRKHISSVRVVTDSETGMLTGVPESAMCVQRFDDSLNSAIHTTYRISLRSSSMPEPRDPLLKVLIIGCFSDKYCYYKGFVGVLAGGRTRRGNERCSKSRVINACGGRLPCGCRTAALR